MSQSRVKWVFWVILAWPIVELVVFVVVAAKTGFGPAFLALLTISLAGVLLLRNEGRAAVSGLRVVLNDRTIRTIDLGGGGLHRWVAGLFLVVPGFVSGVVGLLLLIPTVRKMLGESIRRWFDQGSPGEPGVVDLGAEDWRQVPQERLDDRRDR